MYIYGNSNEIRKAIPDRKTGRSCACRVSSWNGAKKINKIKNTGPAP